MRVRGMAVACAMAMGTLVMPTSFAQDGARQVKRQRGEARQGGERPGRQRPDGGQRGQRGFGGLMGTIESVTETELVIQPMRHAWQGRRPGQGRPQQGGDQPQAQPITIKLTADTNYHEMVDGKEDDLNKGVFVSAVGEGEDTIDARAIATVEAAPEDTDGKQALRSLMLVTMPLRMIAMHGQPGQQRGNGQERPRIGLATGELINEIPYTVKARSWNNQEREVTLTVADVTRYFKLNGIQRGDLVKGRMVSVAPVREQAQRNNPQAARPQQGGDQPAARDITAASIVMMPELPQNARAGQ